MRTSRGSGKSAVHFFAGKFISTQIDKNLSIYLGSIDKYETKHKSSILDFELVADKIICIPRRRIVEFFYNLLRETQKLFLNLLKKDSFKYALFFDSKVVGFNGNLVNSKNIKFLHGYFQTYYYFDQLPPHERKIELRKRSCWLESIEKKINDTNPIILHVRGGDYLKLKNDFGLLSTKYYENSLNHIMKTFGLSAVWVFTNDLNYAKSLFTDKKFKYFQYINVPNEVSDCEVLIAMSYAQKIIISNSTFSWWSAKLGEEKLCICAPDKWFLNREDPDFLIPANWNKIPSYFIQK